MMPTNHGVLSMARTADGKIVATKTYSRFPYKVTVEHDGAIHVKPGDWLSKYSAAMYNNFKGIHEFARKGRDGRLHLILNPNLIYAGETIYHVPTYKYAHPMRMDQLEMVATPWSDEQIEANILKALNQEHQFGGERLHVLTEAVHILHKTADYADGAVLVGELTELLAEGTALASATGLIAAVLTPIMVGLSILDANDTDRRIAACQAIGYALTAWAFDDPIPSYPTILRKRNGQFYGPDVVPRLEAAWRESAAATVERLQKSATQWGKKKKTLQIFWRAIGSDQRQKLARLVMQAVAEEELEGVARDGFWGLDPDQYPN